FAPALGQIAGGGGIGNDGQKKKNHAAGEISKNGEKIPEQRRAKIRPDVAFAGVGNEPVEEPGAAEMADGDDRADGEREDRDGFGAARHRAAPTGIRQAQNSGDKRPGMADSDPENEIGDVK